MSTILKALRRLEDDRTPQSASVGTPEEGDAAPPAEEGAERPSSARTAERDIAEDPVASARDPRATDELRDRILAEERASELASASGADPAASSSPLGVRSLRRWGPPVAVALAIVVLSMVVVPALRDSSAVAPPEVASAPATEDAPAAEPRPATPTGSRGDASRKDVRSDAPRRPPTAVVANAPVAPSPALSARRATPAPEPPPLPSVAAEPIRVSDLPIARGESGRPVPDASPEPAAAAVETEERVVTGPKEQPDPPIPSGTNEPAKEATEARALASSSADDGRTGSESPLSSLALVESRPAPPPPIRPRTEAPRGPSSSSSDPVAKVSEPSPIERLARPAVPDVTVVRTAWHPSTDRRSAKVRLESTEEVMTLREGDAVGALVVKEISPSAVVFETGGVELRRRVGAGR